MMLWLLFASLDHRRLHLGHPSYVKTKLTIVYITTRLFLAILEFILPTSRIISSLMIERCPTRVLIDRLLKPGQQVKLTANAFPNSFDAKEC